MSRRYHFTQDFIASAAPLLHPLQGTALIRIISRFIFGAGAVAGHKDISATKLFVVQTALGVTGNVDGDGVRLTRAGALFGGDNNLGGDISFGGAEPMGPLHFTTIARIVQLGNKGITIASLVSTATAPPDHDRPLPATHRPGHPY